VIGAARAWRQLGSLAVSSGQSVVDVHPVRRHAEQRPACRAGDTLVVTKLDRLARSLPDARAIADELTTRQVKLNLGESVHDPARPGCGPGRA
jgi:Resolvase, N terminal domain